MALQIRAGGVWKTAIPYVKVGGTWKVVTEVWTKVAGVWKLASFSASAAPLSQFDTSAGGGKTFSAVAVTVTGGVAPYNYSWSVQGTDASWLITTGQGTASCVVRGTGLAQGESAQATAVCTVTDSTGAIAYSNEVSFSYYNEGGSGGGPEP